MEFAILNFITLLHYLIHQKKKKRRIDNKKHN